MAGTTPNWRSTALVVYRALLWIQLALAGAGARITLHTDGTPDATANPNAFHVGHSKDGWKCRLKASYIKHKADESAAPLVSIVDEIDMGIAGALLAVTDLDVVKNLLSGIGTYSTASGYKQVTVGNIAITYQSIAAIWPLYEASGYFGVFNIYSTFNQSGIEFDVGRTKMGEMPVDFMGHTISTRADADQVGNYWKTIA